MNLQSHLKLSRLIKKTVVFGRNTIYLNEIKSILDLDYHKNITDNQFKKLGHIYYKGEK